MRISKRKKEKNKIVVVIVVIIVLALTAGAVFWALNHSRDEATDSTAEANTGPEGTGTIETPIEASPTVHVDEGTKVVEQYSGQTEADTNSIEFDNKQFRIPGEGL